MHGGSGALHEESVSLFFARAPSFHHGVNVRAARARRPMPMLLSYAMRSGGSRTHREEIRLVRAAHGTHSIRRTKASLIHRPTKNLRAVQRLLGHAKLESTVRYLGVEVDDALAIAESTEI